MIIRTVSFTNLHGHLNPKLSLQPGVNILTGVNGSGKTSVLNAIAWTLSPASVQDGLPAVHLLSGLRFDDINIEFSTPGTRRYQQVKVNRDERNITIQVSGVEDILEIPVLPGLEFPSWRSNRDVDESANIVARTMEDLRNNVVVRCLSDLSGPLYLPLNRRWTEESDVFHRTRHRRSTTAGHLPISEVLQLAERVFRREQSDIFALNETLRTNILTSMFEVDALGPSPIRRVWTREEFNERRNRVLGALGNLGLSEAKNLSERTLKKLEDVVNELGGETMPSNFLEHPLSEAWFDWLLESSTIAFRIEKLIPLFESYESNRVSATQRSSAFLSSVNNFLIDNGKQLEFTGEGNLSVSLPNGEQIASHQLSSGELQLLILFTFLYFQFNPDEEFAVLVDEPELSLHVSWQHRYVNSVRSANPNAQFIIATHSPEIAGPEVDGNIIDISPKRKNLAEIQRRGSRG